MINKSLKVRIYPTKSQQELIEKIFNACRFTYNFYLTERTQHWIDNKDKTIKDKLLGTSDKCLKEKFPFLKEVDSIAIQQTRRDLDVAFERYFDKVKSKQTPSLTKEDLAKLATRSFKTEVSRYISYHPCHPKFKTKKNPKESYRTFDVNNKPVQVDNENKLIWIPKLKWVKFRHSHEIPSRYKSLTVSKNSLNEFYVSLLFEEDVDITSLENIEESKVVGLDMSAKELAISSNDDTCFSNQKFYRRSERILKIRHRKLSKKKLGSNNFKKQKLVVAKIHKKVERQKNYFLHKLTKYLSDTYDAIFVEDLNIRGMQKFNSGLAKTVSLDLGWSKFIYYLEYKMKWKRKHLVKVSRWFASSKTCSCCGQINNELKLEHREWTCKSCGEIHNRDKNASVNILVEGLRLLKEQGINLVKNSTVEHTGSYAC